MLLLCQRNGPWSGGNRHLMLIKHLKEQHLVCGTDLVVIFLRNQCQREFSSLTTDGRHQRKCTEKPNSNQLPLWSVCFGGVKHNISK